MGGLYPGITPALRDGSLDFGLVPVHKLKLEADLIPEPLFDTEFVIASSRSHPLSSATCIADLTDAQWIFKRTLRTRRGHRGVFAAAGLGKPRRGMVCESFLALPGIVARSNMLATMPRMLFEVNSFRSEMSEIRVADVLPSPTVFVVRRHDLPLTPAASQLIGWIQHYSRKA